MPSPIDVKKMTGPIPGENYTSDTRNYPWHRPPEVTDLDKAIDVTAAKLLSPEGSMGILTMLQLGMDVSTITDTYVTSGIGAGKWTPDFAILMAGPVSHIIVLMAESEGIKYEMGYDSPNSKRSELPFLKAIREDHNKLKVIADNIPVEDVKEKAQGMGLMSMKKGAI